MAQYDLAVLGGGAAGLVAAGIGASLGARTVLIERERLGGDCTWHGCIPSKTLLHEAALAQRRGGRADWAAVRARLDRVRERIYAEADAPDVMARYGVEVCAGSATFVDPHTVRVRSSGGERLVTAARFCISTGSRPQTLRLDVPYVTTETVFELPEIPRRLAIVGAGPAGMELAQAFARLGSAVVVIARGRRVLERDDAEHAQELRAIVEADGVEFLCNEEIVEAAGTGENLHLRLASGRIMHCDKLLIAAGRTPSIDGLGLDRAGVNVRDGAISVDAKCRTSAAHIYATGDVAGPPYFTHAAEEMSKVAMSNALLKLARRYRPSLVPWCTFTSHELAHIGEGESALRARHADYDVYRFDNGALDRAVTDDAIAGSTKLFVGKRGRLLGASILSPRAGETSALVALAMQAKLPVSRLADMLLPYPSYAYGVRRAADGWYTRLLTPFVRRLVKIAFRYRG